MQRVAVLTGRKAGGCIVLCYVVASACLTAVAEEPFEVGIQEHTSRRLVQIDVTVEGDPEITTQLVRGDFEVSVGGRIIEEFTVDGVCNLPPGRSEDKARRDTNRQSIPSPPPRPPVNILLYFDQPHLTMAGRQRSLDVARKLITELDTPFRAMIVSSGSSVSTLTALTADQSQLLEGLDQLEEDRAQWDVYPTQEADRVAEVMRKLDDDGETAALLAASRLQRDEAWRTEKALRRVEMVLGRFASLDPPNVAIYFADTMRSEPGAHYLGLFSTRARRANLVARKIGMRSFASSSVYERVINAASAHAIRLYTVQAEGLVGQPMGTYTQARPSRALSRATPVPSAARLASAQDSLAGWAAETGGRTFLNGVGPAKMARQITADLSCLYLISLDASLVSHSQPLPVLIRVTRPGVSTRTRGRLYVPTESEVLTSRLLTAFLGTDSGTALPLEGAIVPLGFESGNYTALVQVMAPEMSFPGAVWDVGASLLSRGDVRGDTSGRIHVSHPGVPVVLEAEMVIPPGEYEIVMVGHENTSDQVWRGQIEGILLDPDSEGPMVPSIAFLQTSREGILQRSEGLVSDHGRVACRGSCQLKTDETTAVISLVCRGNKKGESVWTTERVLKGETSVRFPAQAITFDKGDRCVQLRDVIRKNTMGDGRFSYEVSVLDGSKQLTTARREFYAVEPPTETAQAN